MLETFTVLKDGSRDILQLDKSTLVNVFWNIVLLGEVTYTQQKG